MFWLIFGMQRLNYAVELQIDNKGRMKDTRLSPLVTWLHIKTAYFSVILPLYFVMLCFYKNI